MNTGARIEQEIVKLSPEALAEFRAWFTTFDADRWDRQIASDAASGKLDALSESALCSHAAGRSRFPCEALERLVRPRSS